MKLLAIPVILTLAAMALPSGSGQTANPLPARMQHAAEFYRNRDGFMGMVEVQRNHHLIYRTAFGYANVKQHTPFTADTPFRIGSISKQFTAAAILLLQQDGKLKTSDPISLYYKNAPASWSSITLRNLLTHTSGIPDFDFGLIYRNSPHRPEELLRDVVTKPVEFRPGTKFEYSNANYLLLGLVVEQASGEPFCQFLSDRIFRPLHLKHTGCDGGPYRASHRAHGYHPSASGPVQWEDKDLSGTAGAGSLDSTANDLIRWTEALFGGKVLPKASLTEMTTPFLDGYAYGFSTDGEGAELDISHIGAVDGFYSCLDYLPATKTTVVVLSNLVAEGNQTTPGTLALDTELVRLAMHGDAILPSDGKEASVPEEILRSYAGHYRSDDPDHPVGITLTFRDGRLLIQNDGGDARPLNAESTSRFYLANQETEVVFDPHVAGSFEFLNYAPVYGSVFKRDSAGKKSPLAAK